MLGLVRSKSGAQSSIQSPMWVTTTCAPGLFSVAFPGALERAKVFIRSEESGLEALLTWEACNAGCGLTCCAITLVPVRVC